MRHAVASLSDGHTLPPLPGLDLGASQPAFCKNLVAKPQDPGQAPPLSVPASWPEGRDSGGLLPPTLDLGALWV